MMRLEEVSFTYASGVAAVRSVSTTLGKGELISLIGPNGSGKSTLMKMMARVASPSSGNISFLGRPVSDWDRREFARETGYLPQEFEPVFPMRAIDVVLSGRAPFLRRFEWESTEDYDIAGRALADCDAAHLSERFLEEMSGGERKRVFLARVLAGTPRLILLDEPLAALDLSHVQQFSRLLRDVVDRTGCTVLFAAHDLNWAAAHSDRMLVMQRGALALDAPPAEVMTAGVMKTFFGFEAETLAAGGRTWIVPKVHAP